MFTFATARITAGEEKIVTEWRGEPMATQYAVGVKDFDEARGLAVFGNAFGELYLCDFSGTNPTQLKGFLYETIAPNLYGNEELLPTVSERHVLDAPPLVTFPA